jgi:hypothetical protein
MPKKLQNSIKPFSLSYIANQSQLLYLYISLPLYENSETMFYITIRVMALCMSITQGCLEQELQMVQLSAIRCSYSTVLWVSLMSLLP